MNRRSFITGLTGLLAAPAIVRVASIMPVSVVTDTPATVASIDCASWVHVRVWLANAGNRMRYEISRDGGVTWTVSESSAILLPNGDYSGSIAI